MVRCPGCDFSCKDGLTGCERCGANISVVCAQCNAGNPALARFCCGCGARLDAAGEDRKSPVSLAQPEWRQLTVLFCDVVGSTALGHRLDPEEWHRVLQRLHSLGGELIAKHHGYVAQYLGDGLLAYFGYPVAAEDAPRRAAAAALALSEQVRGIALRDSERLSVRVGIHSGPVIVSNIGSRRHQESLALGETPARAARLQDLAPPGGVVVSLETKRLIDGFFDCEELGKFPLKGFPEAQLVYRVVAERGPTTRLEAASAAGLTPLVGRAAELGVLKGRWTSVADGDASSILVLTGEPGIGKSRLVYELKRAIHSKASILELRCFQHVRTSALHPVIDCLYRETGHRHSDARGAAPEQLSQALRKAELTPAQEALMLALFGVPLEPSLAPAPHQLREATLEAIAAWVVGPLSVRPRLVVIEDAQWADAATLDLLSALFAALPERVLFVLTARPEFSPPWSKHVSTLNLGRLGASETRELVTQVAGNKPLPREVVERLAARSECIPLFLEEMTKTVIDSGLVRETASEFVLDAPVRDGSIPASLYDSLTARLDQLGHGKPVAQLAAVLGREFRFSLFEAVWRKIPAAPGISLIEALERLVGAQLLLREQRPADDIYQFRHALIQEAAYQSLLKSARQDYHRHAAEAIVDVFPGRAELEPELVAYHYAGAEERRRAIDYWEKAGQRAIRTSAYVEAISHFQGGIAQIAELETGAETSRLELGLRTGLGITLITSRGFASKEVEETYARAAELCDELGDEIPVRILYGTWAVNLVRGDLASTSRMLPGLERLALSAEDAGARLVGHASLSTWTFWRGEYAKSMHHSAAAMALIDTSNPKEQHGALLRDHGFEGSFSPAVYLAWSQVLTGEIDAARRTWRDVMALTEGIADPYVSAAVFAFGCALHHDFGDLAGASELATKLRELCQDKPFPLWHGVGLIVGGACQVDQGGDIDEAIEQIQRGIKMYRGTGAATPCSYHLRYLAEAYLAKGDAPRAIETLQEALGMMRVNLDRNFEPEMLRLLGTAYLSCNDLDLAVQTLSTALELSRAQGAKLLELKVAMSLAQALQRRGQQADAGRVLGPVARSFSGIRDFAPLRRAEVLLQNV